MRLSRRRFLHFFRSKIAITFSSFFSLHRFIHRRRTARSHYRKSLPLLSDFLSPLSNVVDENRELGRHYARHIDAFFLSSTKERTSTTLQLLMTSKWDFAFRWDRQTALISHRSGYDDAADFWRYRHGSQNFTFGKRLQRKLRNDDERKFSFNRFPWRILIYSNKEFFVISPRDCWEAAERRKSPRSENFF